MSGSPLRPDRDSFGPTLQNSAPVRDARFQISAEILNLVEWQVAGMGLVMPRAVLHFIGQASPSILGRAEAWNPKRLTTGQHANPGITVTGAGNYLVEYPTPVPDENDVDQVLSFQWADVMTVNDDPTVLKHAQAAVVSGSTNQIRVCSFSNANALQHGNTLVLLAW